MVFCVLGSAETQKFSGGFAPWTPLFLGCPTVAPTGGNANFLIAFLHQSKIRFLSRETLALSFLCKAKPEFFFRGLRPRTRVSPSTLESSYAGENLLFLLRRALTRFPTLKRSTTLRSPTGRAACVRLSRSRGRYARRSTHTTSCAPPTCRV